MLDAADRRTAHLDHARMLGSGLPDGVVLSHESAAIVHGLATYGVPAAVRLTGTHVRAMRTSDAHIHRAQLRDDDVTDVEGIPVTSMARTVVDLGRRLPFGAALVTADAALRAGCSPRELADVLRHQWTWPRVRHSMPVVRHADRKSESPLESVVRGRIIVLRLPPPRLQVNLYDGRIWIARSDFEWPELNLVGEADGRSKYVTDELWAEKERQDLIEDSGRVVIRWTWRTAHVSDEEFVARFRRYERRALLLRAALAQT